MTPEQLPFRAALPGLPVDVEGIARHLGATVHRARSNPRWVSCLDRRDGTPRIWVRPTDQPVYQRFGVAHALGHLLLPGHDALLYRETSYLDGEQDREANRFAMRLLMPEAAVRLHLERHGVQGLPEAFGVSEALCGARPRMLGITV